jgi:WD repeat-containing protein 24
VFALVTSSGALIVYSQFVSARALVKLNAHSGDATSLDWHPTRRNIIATGGARDRCVKIWNLDYFLSVLFNNSKDESNMYANANTLSSRGDSVVSDSSGNDSHR